MSAHKSLNASLENKTTRSSAQYAAQPIGTQCLPLIPCKHYVGLTETQPI